MTNPFLSMWLSAFNSAAGAARGYAMAEMQRQQAALWREMMRHTLDFWSGAWLTRPARSGERRSAPSRSGR